MLAGRWLMLVTNRMLRGRDGRSGRSAQAARIAVVDAASRVGAGRRRTTSTATIASGHRVGPRRRPGRARRRGPAPIRSSIGSGCTLTPPTLMTSAARPRKTIRSSTISTRSPVGRQPSGSSTGGLAVVAEHPGAGAHPELAVDDLHRDVGIVAAVEHVDRQPGRDRRGPTRWSRTRTRRRSGRPPRPGRLAASSLEQRAGDGLAAERDLAQRGRRPAVGAQLGEQEAPVRRRGAGVGDAELPHRGQALARPSRGGRDQRGARGEDVEQDLESGELVRPVGEQPALARAGPEARRAEQPGPVVPHPSRGAGGAGGEHEMRLGAGVASSV